MKLIYEWGDQYHMTPTETWMEICFHHFSLFALFRMQYESAARAQWAYDADTPKNLDYIELMLRESRSI